MHWLIADILMFICSVVLFLAVRAAALRKLPHQFNNLAMTVVPLLFFAGASVVTGTSLAVGWLHVLELIVVGVALSYYSNVLSLKSIALAPNAGYSLLLSKSYVVLTTFLAVPLFGAQLSWFTVLAAAIIVASLALLLVRPSRAKHGNAQWVPLALGAMVGLALLALAVKYFALQGIPTITILTYVFAAIVVCTLLEMAHKKLRLALNAQIFGLFLLIGFAGVGFNYFNFYAIAVAPNVGYVNATNLASLGAVTLLSVPLFRDELTRRTLAGTIGTIIGLILLLLWS